MWDFGTHVLKTYPFKEMSLFCVFFYESFAVWHNVTPFRYKNDVCFDFLNKNKEKKNGLSKGGHGNFVKTTVASNNLHVAQVCFDYIEKRLKFRHFAWEFVVYRGPKWFP